MLSGKRFRLHKATIAVDTIDGKRIAISIPEDAIVKVISDPPGDGVGTIKVLWEGRTVVMFAVDLARRGAELTDRTASA